jgi:hypothetical protein
MVFNQLMFCLSSDSIKEHSEYRNWSPLSGRLRCFEKLRQYLDVIYPISREELKMPQGSFNELLYGCLTGSTTKHSRTSSLSLNDLRKKDDGGLLVIEDDLKVKTALKDDADAFLKKSNNSVLKAIRNEKISQSLQVNKVSEIEQELGKDKIYQIEEYEEGDMDVGDQYKSGNKYNKYDDNQEVDFSIIEEDTVINNKRDMNALSDLDKDEYYMKSCYEFYDYVSIKHYG